MMGKFQDYCGRLGFFCGFCFCTRHFWPVNQDRPYKILHTATRLARLEGEPQVTFQMPFLFKAPLVGDGQGEQVRKNNW